MDTAYRVSPLRVSDPDWLGEYQLVGRLGAGGMGVVYLAESDDGSYVAIKLIHAAIAADPEFSGRFRSEVERSREVPSFCTAEFLGADLDHDPPYLVVEYVDGPSLDDVVVERGPLRGGALHSLAVGVATALAGIHGAGVIHRDLKPDNVLLPPGSPKVIDFGIARPFVATSKHTQADVMVGTVPYMAPERFSDEPGVAVTAAADVFAWGCVIAYAGTGRTPFLGDSLSATVGRILTQPPRLNGLPESLRDPVLLALSKDPAERPTAPELLAMLVGGQPVPRPAAADPDTRQTSARSNRGGRTLLMTLAALLVLAGLTIFALVANDRNAAGTANAASTAPTLAYAAPSLPASAPSVSEPPKAASSPGPSRSATSPRSNAAPSTARASANPSRRNLALGRRAIASSAEGDAWSASQAVDGDLQSRWSSGFSDPQWLTVDLGAQWQISSIVLRWEHAYAVGYRVQTSADGQTWKTVYGTSTGQGGDVTVTTDNVSGRYVRMYGTRRSGQYGYSLYEIEVR